MSHGEFLHATVDVYQGLNLGIGVVLLRSSMIVTASQGEGVFYQ